MEIDPNDVQKPDQDKHQTGNNQAMRINEFSQHDKAALQVDRQGIKTTRISIFFKI